MPAPLACGDRCPAVLEEPPLRLQAQRPSPGRGQSAGTVPCPGSARRKTRCVRFAHSAQTVAPSQSTRRAGARGPALLCSSAWHRGNSKQPTARTAINAQFPGCWLLPLCAAEQHSLPGQRAERAFPSNSAQLFERSERSERSEFWAGPGKRAAQGTPAAGWGCASGPCSLLTFLHEQESESPAGATSRRAASITSASQYSARNLQRSAH